MYAGNAMERKARIGAVLPKYPHTGSFRFSAPYGHSLAPNRHGFFPAASHLPFRPLLHLLRGLPQASVRFVQRRGLRHGFC